MLILGGMLIMYTRVHLKKALLGLFKEVFPRENSQMGGTQIFIKPFRKSLWRGEQNSCVQHVFEGCWLPARGVRVCKKMSAYCQLVVGGEGGANLAFLGHQNENLRFWFETIWKSMRKIFIIHYSLFFLSSHRQLHAIFLVWIFDFFRSKFAKCHFQVQKRLLFEQESSEWWNDCIFKKLLSSRSFWAQTW